jgi:hypothetical protein
MSAVVKNKLLLYADDSGILVTGKSKNQIETVLTSELETVSEWLICNKLSLHLGKTESILFGSKPKIRSHSGMEISCNGKIIDAVHSVKYLGATLDQSLSGEPMARSVISKANARLKFLYRKRDFLTQHTRKLLVTSLIQCHFDYACSFWYQSLTQLLKNRLQTTQNKLVRFVLNMDSMSHVGPGQFRYLKWLPVEKRVNQIILGHVFKVKSGIAPDYLGEHFNPVHSLHTHRTRFRVTSCPNPDDPSMLNFNDSGCFCIPKVKGFGKKSFAYQGCVLWNNLPQLIRNITVFKHFKEAVKLHFLS